MFPDLINSQVCCYKDGSLVGESLSLLQFMYPNFKVVKTEFDIYPNEPFIYIGDIKWAYKIQKHTEPHIIVATTGEYDLTDMKTLIDLAFKKHNKKVPQYMEEIIESWKPSNNKQVFTKDFIYNWKYIWINGQPVDKIVEKNTLFLDMLDNLSKPVDVLKIYTEALSKYGNEEGTSFLEKAMISFIKKSRNLSSQNTKSDKMLKIRTSFIYSFDNNIHDAVENLLDSPNDNQSLRFMNFLLDMIWARR